MPARWARRSTTAQRARCATAARACAAATLLMPGCGNGVVETGEDCDDGNDDPSDGCTMRLHVHLHRRRNLSGRHRLQRHGDLRSDLAHLRWQAPRRPATTGARLHRRLLRRRARLRDHPDRHGRRRPRADTLGRLRRRLRRHPRRRLHRSSRSSATGATTTAMAASTRPPPPGTSTATRTATLTDVDLVPHELHRARRLGSRLLTGRLDDAPARRRLDHRLRGDRSRVEPRAPPRSRATRSTRTATGWRSATSTRTTTRTGGRTATPSPPSIPTAATSTKRRVATRHRLLRQRRARAAGPDQLLLRLCGLGLRWVRLRLRRSRDSAIYGDRRVRLSVLRLQFVGLFHDAHGRMAVHPAGLRPARALLEPHLVPADRGASIYFCPTTGLAQAQACR